MIQGSTLYPVHTCWRGPYHQRECPANLPPYLQCVLWPHPAGILHYPILPPTPPASGKDCVFQHLSVHMLVKTKVSLKKHRTKKFSRAMDCTKHHHLLWTLLSLSIELPGGPMSSRRVHHTVLSVINMT